MTWWAFQAKTQIIAARRAAVGKEQEQTEIQDRHRARVQQLTAELEALRPANMETIRRTQQTLQRENTVLKQQVADLAHKTVTGVYNSLLDMATTMARLGKNEDGSDDATFRSKVDFLVKCSLLGQPMTARELADKTAPIGNRLWEVYTRAARNEQIALTTKLLDKSGQKRQRK